MEHSSSINPLSHTSQEGWSLPAVKQALSHLRWQRDRLHHLHSSTSHGPDSPLAKTCSVVVNCAVGLFNHEADDEAYLDRALIVQHMLIQQRRALVSHVHNVKRLCSLTFVVVLDMFVYVYCTVYTVHAPCNIFCTLRFKFRIFTCYRSVKVHCRGWWSFCLELRALTMSYPRPNCCL